MRILTILAAFTVTASSEPELQQLKHFECWPIPGSKNIKCTVDRIDQHSALGKITWKLIISRTTTTNPKWTCDPRGEFTFQPMYGGFIDLHLFYMWDPSVGKIHDFKAVVETKASFEVGAYNVIIGKRSHYEDAIKCMDYGTEYTFKIIANNYKGKIGYWATCLDVWTSSSNGEVLGHHNQGKGGGEYGKGYCCVPDFEGGRGKPCGQTDVPTATKEKCFTIGECSAYADTWHCHSGPSVGKEGIRLKKNDHRSFPKTSLEDCQARCSERDQDGKARYRSLDWNPKSCLCSYNAPGDEGKDIEVIYRSRWTLCVRDCSDWHGGSLLPPSPHSVIDADDKCVECGMCSRCAAPSECRSMADTYSCISGEGNKKGIAIIGHDDRVFDASSLVDCQSKCNGLQDIVTRSLEFPANVKTSGGNCVCSQVSPWEEGVQFTFVYEGVQLCVRDCKVHGTCCGFNDKAKKCLTSAVSEKGCFGLFTSPRQWSNASAHCKSIGGSLAEATNLEDYNAFAGFAQKCPTWLGGSDTKAEGLWKWEASDLIIPKRGEEGFQHWRSDEPALAKDKHCLQYSSVDRPWTDGYWQAGTCKSKRYFVCQKKEATGKTPADIQESPCKPYGNCKELASTYTCTTGQDVNQPGVALLLDSPVKEIEMPSKKECFDKCQSLDSNVRSIMLSPLKNGNKKKIGCSCTSKLPGDEGVRLSYSKRHYELCIRDCKEHVSPVSPFQGGGSCYGCGDCTMMADTYSCTTGRHVELPGIAIAGHNDFSLPVANLDECIKVCNTRSANVSFTTMTLEYRRITGKSGQCTCARAAPGSMEAQLTYLLPGVALCVRDCQAYSVAGGRLPAGQASSVKPYVKAMVVLLMISSAVF